MSMCSGTRNHTSCPVQRYDIANADGTFSEKYWKTLNVPVLNNGGDVTHIIHTVEDVSALVKADQRLESTKASKRHITSS
jgi:hypothetical protein